MFDLSPPVRARRWLFAAAAILAGSGGVAQAACVVELFTSQGCSSCPPADRLLETMARSPDVVALSFPVDYWDYIGWKDTFASPVFTARQKAYAAIKGSTVYTPQVMVDGLIDAVGSNRVEIDRAIKAAQGRDGAMSVAIRLSKADGRIRVDIGPGRRRAGRDRRAAGGAHSHGFNRPRRKFRSQRDLYQCRAPHREAGRLGRHRDAGGSSRLAGRQRRLRGARPERYGGSAGRDPRRGQIDRPLAGSALGPNFARIDGSHCRRPAPPADHSQSAAGSEYAYAMIRLNRSGSFALWPARAGGPRCHGRARAG